MATSTTPTPRERARFAAEIAQDIRNSRAADNGIAEERAIWVSTVRQAALAIGDNAELLLSSITDTTSADAGYDADEAGAIRNAYAQIRLALRRLEDQGLGL